MKWIKRLDQYSKDNALSIVLGFFVLFVAAVSLIPISLYDVRSGEVGVLWSRFDGGTITKHVYREGIHFKWPWNIVYLYNVRLQTDTHTYDALSSDGTAFKAELAFTFQVQENDAGILQKLVGPDYLNIVLRPAVGAAFNTAVSQFPTSALYSKDRIAIEKKTNKALTIDANDLLAHLETSFGYPIIIYGISLQGVTLPPGLQTAIEGKMVQDQYAEEYVYRIQREKLEAQRKAIEAVGIRNFEQTTTMTTDQYLRWTGIAATVELAKSPNSRLVIIGGAGGLPLILNTPTDSSSPARSSIRSSAQTPLQDSDNPIQSTNPTGFAKEIPSH